MARFAASQKALEHPANQFFILTRFLDANRYPLRLKTLCRPVDQPLTTVWYGE
jgi:hypothetical protein